MALRDWFSNPEGKDVKITSDAPNGATSYSFISGDEIVLTEDKVLKIDAIQQALAIICDTIASMPVYLYKPSENGEGKEKVDNDSRNYLLSNMANPYMSAYSLKKNLFKDAILHGNGYTKVVRTKKGEVQELVYVPAFCTTPAKDKNGYFFKINQTDTGVHGERIEEEVVDFADMLMIMTYPKLGSTVKGMGLMDFGADVLKTALEQSIYISNLYANGLTAKSVLNVKNPLKPEVKNRLKESIKEFYSGIKNAGKVMVLEGDMEILPLSMRPADIEFNKSQEFVVQQISRLLNIPKNMLNIDVKSGVYSNITQQNMSLLQRTLTPYIVNFQETLNNSLLTTEEKANGWHFQLSTQELLKSTPEEYAQYVGKLLENGIITVNEARKKLDYDPLEDSEIEQILKQNGSLTYNTSAEDKKADSDKKETKEETTEKDSKLVDKKGGDKKQNDGTKSKDK